MKSKFISLCITILCVASGTIVDFSEVRGRSNENQKKIKNGFKSGTKDDFYNHNSVYLRIKNPLKNKNATSGDTIHFKCKVDGWPHDALRYSWYKDNKIINDTQEPNIHIKTRRRGTSLRIKYALTVDSGIYRCEASNRYRIVQSSARLAITFKRPPPSNEIDTKRLNFPESRCEPYIGHVCAEYLKGMKIHVETFQEQKEMENQIQQLLKQISNTSVISRNCQELMLPAICFFVFTPCYIAKNGKITRGEKLCKEDCESLKADMCHQEILQRKRNPLLKKIFNSANCSSLPSSRAADCVKIGLQETQTENKEKTCFKKNGSRYRGRINVAKSGVKCAVWPLQMAKKHPELLGYHNFCRNPNGVYKKPWCYIDSLRIQKEACNIIECDESSKRNVPVIIAFLCSCIVFLTVVFCSCFWCIINRKQNGNIHKQIKYSQELQADLMLLQKQHPNPIWIDPSFIVLLRETSTGKFGKVYDGIITNNPHFYEKQQLSFKFFDHCHILSNQEAFKREKEILFRLNHINITNLKGVSYSDQNTNVLIFESSTQTDLHEYLLNVYKSRIVNSIKSNHYDSGVIPLDVLIRMSLQIASGMDYLLTKNYIHRDLALRNILMCDNMELKISVLGEIKDFYKSAYYRTVQGELFPIRWMAPESLQSWQFSDKSTVWSFGVLLWEMFSYGAQPYYGYNNQEVLNMISSRQLLSCPDQCPAKMYSLMSCCWKKNPLKRRDYKEIIKKLRNSFKNRSGLSKKKNTLEKSPVDSQNDCELYLGTVARETHQTTKHSFN